MQFSHTHYTKSIPKTISSIHWPILFFFVFWKTNQTELLVKSKQKQNWKMRHLKLCMFKDYVVRFIIALTWTPMVIWEIREFQERSGGFRRVSFHVTSGVFQECFRIVPWIFRGFHGASVAFRKCSRMYQKSSKGFERSSKKCKRFQWRSSVFQGRFRGISQVTERGPGWHVLVLFGIFVSRQKDELFTRLY